MTSRDTNMRRFMEASLFGLAFGTVFYFVQAKECRDALILMDLKGGYTLEGCHMLRPDNSKLLLKYYRAD